MNTKIEKLKEKIKNVYGQDPWYGESIMAVLNKTNPDIVLKKANSDTHSIAELLAHIIGWREFTMRKLKKDYDFKMEQSDSFDWKRINSNEDSVWKSLLEAMEKNQDEFIKILESSDDEFLTETVHDRNYNAEFLIEGLIQHDVYHLGQISLLKKILRSD